MNAPKPRIDWGMASLILAVTLAILSGWSAYNNFNGATGQRLDALEDRLNDLRDDLRELRRR